VKLVKLKASSVWHHHDNEDELFLVVKGRRASSCATRMSYSAWRVRHHPRGVEHLPVADEETTSCIPAHTTLTPGRTSTMNAPVRAERL